MIKRILILSVIAVAFSACCKDNKCDNSIKYNYGEGVMTNKTFCGWIIHGQLGGTTFYKAYNLPAAYQNIEGLPVRFWFKDNGESYICDPDQSPPYYDQLNLHPIELCDIEYKD